MTSHAAVVARGWGKPCVCGASDLEVDEAKKMVTVKSSGERFYEGDVISLDGSSGTVLKGSVSVSEKGVYGCLETVLGWADDVARMPVFANADAPQDASVALRLGAKGIGLCRTEHMFFTPERLPVVRRWILSGEGIDKLERFQQGDFQGLFETMADKPVTIRLLDPPLHEFLPKPGTVTEDLAHDLGFDGQIDKLIEKINELQEENPMLGLRGCRLGIVHPEMTIMQAEAIAEAAYDAFHKTGIKPKPKIMVPLVGSIAELQHQALLIKQTCKKISDLRGNFNGCIDFEIGTMIEIPRAALISDQIAELKDPTDSQPLCDFFSYGTNDLTQMTMGISRDDANEFVPEYLKLGIYTHDPFKTIDVEGVGSLVSKSTDRKSVV